MSALDQASPQEEPGGGRGNQRPRKSASPDPIQSCTRASQSSLLDLGRGAGDPGRSLRRGRPCRPPRDGEERWRQKGDEPDLAGQGQS